MNGKNRINIKPGIKVNIVLKQDQRSGKLTEGIVKEKISTVVHADNGIVVVLEKDQNEIEHQGRVHKILDPNFIDKNKIVECIKKYKINQNKANPNKI